MNGHVRPLRLPADCPPATNCGVEITLHSGEKAAIIASYLPQPMEEHKRTCHALARLHATLPYHLLIIGGDLQGGWTCPNPKDAHIHTLPFSRWRGAENPTFVPPHLPGVATCIDHLTIWDPRHLSEQIVTPSPSPPLLDHKGVMWTMHLPVLMRRPLLLHLP